MKNNESKNLNLEELSPYDFAYPATVFSKNIKNKLEEAQNTSKRIYQAIVKEAPTLTQVQQSLKKGYRLVVDVSEDTLKDIESGKIKLTSSKNGKTYAQIQDANGKYGSKLPIKKEHFGKGIDPVQMANAMQMKALQDQLEVITDQLQVIGQSVESVLLGQQNDRISLYYSGMALYLEAQNIANNDMKQALTTQALRALADATFQLTLTMQSDIQYLNNEEYKLAKGKKVELIDKRIQDINRSFTFIHQSTMLRAGIYCNVGELSAMATVLNEYSHFIEHTVANNASLLAQCDVTDNGTDAGVWKSRALLKLDVKDFAKSLSNPEKTIYLSMMEESKQ